MGIDAMVMTQEGAPQEEQHSSQVAEYDCDACTGHAIYRWDANERRSLAMIHTSAHTAKHIHVCDYSNIEA